MTEGAQGLERRHMCMRKFGGVELSSSWKVQNKWGVGEGSMSMVMKEGAGNAE